ncbi:MFS general substrate transporter [Xylaria arbuscula]|nr:MFS general substrate transporter [Xylaria arbuscula]
MAKGQEKSPGASTPGADSSTSEDPNVAKDLRAHEAEKQEVPAQTAKRELKEEDCEDELGFAFSEKKKWWILTVIFLVQTSMNFNTSLYSNGLVGISEEFNVSEQAARVGAAIYLITYAFGCELWAPWSEEFGRKPILQLSLLLTNLWNLPVVLAPNFGSLLVGRALGGLSTAGGSVTLGMIADLYEADRQQYAVAYIVFSSVGGSVLGPIVGGFVEILPPDQAWKWCIWIQLIFGAFVQVLHFFTVPETRTTVMMNKIAKNRRKNNIEEVYGPDEIESFWDRFTVKELIHTWLRPFRMFLTEPIVLSLSLLSGFSDALIFVQIQSLGLVFKQWDFNSWQIGLAFVGFGVGYLLAWLIFIPSFSHNKKRRERNPDDEHAQYESRMYLLLWLAPMLPIGLLIFAFVSAGPPLHWIGPIIATAIIGIANYAIYMATIDYMICAYGPYSASATGGNGWARDFLAGVLTVPATPFYTNIGAAEGKNFEYPSLILFAISVILVAAVYWVYWKGPELRKRSPFAQSLAQGTAEVLGRRVSNATRRSSTAGHPNHPPTTAGAAGEPDIEHAAAVSPASKTPNRPRFGPESRRSSYEASHHATSRRQSRNASRNPSRNPSRRNSMEEDEDEVHDMNAEAVNNRLRNHLTTIPSVQDHNH